MKKYIICLFAFCFTFSLQAQIKSYVSVWGQAGEASLITNMPDFGPYASLGVGGGIGAGYELQASHFLFSTGLGVNVSNSSFSLFNAKFTLQDIYDGDGDSFTFVLEHNQRKDSYTNVAIQIPLMVGAQVQRFYCLAGFKFDISAFSHYNIHARTTTYGVYDMFFEDEPFVNMPTHGFYDNQPMHASGKTTFNANIVGSVEIGLRIGRIEKATGWDVPKQKHSYRLAIFADYGLLDLHTKGDQSLLTLPATILNKDVLNNTIMNDFLSTKEVLNPVHNLMIGIKFIAMFALPETNKICRICED